MTNAIRLRDIGHAKSKMLFFSVQIISNFANISSQTPDNILFPDPAAAVATALGITNLNVFSFTSLRCMVPETHFYTNLLIKTTSPFVVICLMFLYPLTRRLRRTPHQAAWQLSAQHALTFIEVFLPSITTTIIHALVCEEFDDGHFLRVEYSAPCDGSMRRKMWVACASLMIAVYPLGEFRKQGQASMP